MRTSSYITLPHIFSYLVILAIGFVVTTSVSAANITIDTTGGEDSRMALDSSGNPVIAHLNGGKVRLAVCDDERCAEDVTITPDIVTGVNAFDMVLDADDNPIIVYQGTAQLNLYALFCGDTTCTSNNTVVSLDSDQAVGSYLSAKLDSNGMLVVSYYDAIDQELNVAVCGDAMCSAVMILVVSDSVPFGMYSSMVLDDQDRPIIAYQGQGELRIIFCDDVVCSSGNIVSGLDTSANGYFNSIKLDSSGFPVVSYTNSLDQVRVLICGDAMCATSIVEVIDPSGTNSFPSLAIDSNDYPVISYSTSTGMELATCEDELCQVIGIEEIENLGSLNQGSFLILDEDDIPLVSYHDSSDNNLNFYYPGAEVTPPDNDNNGDEGTNGGGTSVISRIVRQRHNVRGTMTSPNGIICPFFTEYLRRGDRDGVNGKHDVAKLQRFLNERGYVAGRDDGIFGMQTTGALKRWQSAFANEVLAVWSPVLKPTGIFYKSSRYLANKQMGCLTTIMLENGIVLQ